MRVREKSVILKEQGYLARVAKRFNKNGLERLLEAYVAGLSGATGYRVRLDYFDFKVKKKENYILEFYLEMNLEFNADKENREKLTYFYKVFKHSFSLDFKKSNFNKEDLEEKIFTYLKNKKIDFDYEQAKSRVELAEMFEEENIGEGI